MFIFRIYDDNFNAYCSTALGNRMSFRMEIEATGLVTVGCCARVGGGGCRLKLGEGDKGWLGLEGGRGGSVVTDRAKEQLGKGERNYMPSV